MEISHNVVGWFEIPVNDMERAVGFYETVFGFSLTRQKVGELDMAWFPWKEDGVGSTGSLIYEPETYKPSPDGIIIYFTAFSGDLDVELSKVEPAGGTILMPKMLITEEIGYMALLLDSEGNRIALHSRK